MEDTNISRNRSIHGSIVAVTNRAHSAGSEPRRAAVSLRIAASAAVGALCLAFPVAVWAQAVDAPAPAPQAASPALSKSYSTPAPTLRLDIPHSYNPIDAYRPAMVPQPNLANSSAHRQPHSRRRARDLAQRRDRARARKQSRPRNRPLQHSHRARRRPAHAGRRHLPRRQHGRRPEHPGRRRRRLWFGKLGRGGWRYDRRCWRRGHRRVGPGAIDVGHGNHRLLLRPNDQRDAQLQHLTQPLANISIYGVQSLHTDTITGNVSYAQAFPTGTSLSVAFNNDRITSNSIYTYLLPELDSYSSGRRCSSSCSPASDSVPTCAICASHATTRRSPTRPSNCRSSPPSRRSPTCTGTSWPPTRTSR